MKVTFIPDCVLFPSVRQAPTVLYQLHRPAAPALRVLPNRLVLGRHRPPLHHDHKEHISYLSQRIPLGFWSVLTPLVSVRISPHSILQNYLGKLYFNNLKNNPATPPCSPVNYELKYLPFLPSSFTCCYGEMGRVLSNHPFPTDLYIPADLLPVYWSGMLSYDIMPTLCPNQWNEHGQPRHHTPNCVLTGGMSVQSL